MTQNRSPYTPISCEFHSRLEALIVFHARCRLRYRTEQGEMVTCEDFLEDVYARDKQEFLRLRGGLVIRLDRLLEVKAA